MKVSHWSTVLKMNWMKRIYINNNRGNTALSCNFGKGIVSCCLFLLPVVLVSSEKNLKQGFSIFNYFLNHDTTVYEINIICFIQNNYSADFFIIENNHKWNKRRKTLLTGKSSEMIFRLGIPFKKERRWCKDKN